MQKILLIIMFVGILFSLYWFYIKFDEDEKLILKNKNNSKTKNNKPKIKHKEDEQPITDNSFKSFDVNVIGKLDKTETDESFNLPNNESDESGNPYNRKFDNDSQDSAHSFALQNYSDKTDSDGDVE